MRLIAVICLIVFLGCSSSILGDVDLQTSVDVAEKSDTIVINDAKPADSRLNSGNQDLVGPRPDDLTTKMDVPAKIDLHVPSDVVGNHDLAGDSDLTTPDVAPGDSLGEITTVARQIDDPNAAISSYLLSVGGWGNFGGDVFYFGRHTGTGQPSYHTGLRFTKVAIPAGSTIKTATLELWPAHGNNLKNHLKINIKAHRHPNSPQFDLKNYTSGRPDQRLKTAAKLEWVVRCRPDCDAEIFGKYCAQYELDCWDKQLKVTLPKNLAPLIQEIIDLDGWSTGNALSILLTNAASDNDGRDYKSSRGLIGYDTELGLQYRPRLTITFIAP